MLSICENARGESGEGAAGGRGEGLTSSQETNRVYVYMCVLPVEISLLGQEVAERKEERKKKVSSL